MQKDDGIFKTVADNGSNMVKGWHSLACIDHTIERSVRLLWIEPQVKESFDKGKKVVTFCQRGDRTKCIHANATGGQRHRPSHVVEAAPGRVPAPSPHGQAVPGRACQLCVS